MGSTIEVLEKESFEDVEEVEETASESVSRWGELVVLVEWLDGRVCRPDRRL